MYASTKEYIRKHLNLNNINSTHPEVTESTPVEPYTNDESVPPNGNLGSATISALVAIRDTPSVNEEGLHRSDREPQGGQADCHDQPKMTFLAHYFCLTHMLGLTPSNYDSSMSYVCAKTILFAVIGTLSAFNAFSIAKFYYLYGMKDAEKAKQIVLSYITLGNYINTLLLRIAFLLTMCVYTRKLKDVVKTLKEWVTLFHDDIDHHAKTWVIRLIVGLSIITAIVSPVMSGIFHGRNITKILLWHSKEFSNAIFLWKRENDYEALNQLYDDYGIIPTNRNMALGISHLGISIISLFHESCVRDCCLILAFSMYHMTHEFQRKFKKYNIRQEISEENVETIWRMYKIVRHFSEQLANCMGVLINLVHVDTVIFSAYFLYDHIIEGSGNVSLAEIHMILKLACFYFVSTIASSVNSSFRAWLKTTFPSGHTLFIENGEHVSTLTIFDDLTNSPIGVGSSVCFIDKTFLWKVLSVVGSFFIFFADVREDEM